jgi:hypothetical protein
MARLVVAMLVLAVLVAGCGGASGQEPATSPAQPPAGLASAAATVGPTPTPAPTPSPTPSPTPAPTAGWLVRATAVRATPSTSGRVQISQGAGFPVKVLAATQTVAGVAWHHELP